MDTINASCELCQKTGGTILFQSPAYRIVRVDDPHYPGFCRVIWTAHVREMTDLPETSQARLMRVVFAVERVVRRLVAPEKINLASFGNMVPHIHWHIIPRWRDDRHFPDPIWGQVHRPDAGRLAIPEDHLWQRALHEELAALGETHEQHGQ